MKLELKIEAPGVQVFAYEAHEKGEDDWFPSYQVSGWLSES